MWVVTFQQGHHPSQWGSKENKKWRKAAVVST